MSACKLYTWPLPSRSRRTAGPPTPGLGTSSVTSAVAGASGEGRAFGGRPSARRHRKDVLVLVPSQPPRQDSASGPPHREGASRPAPQSSAVLGRGPGPGPPPAQPMLARRSLQGCSRGRCCPPNPQLTGEDLETAEVAATSASAGSRAGVPCAEALGASFSPRVAPGPPSCCSLRLPVPALCAQPRGLSGTRRPSPGPQPWRTAGPDLRAGSSDHVVGFSRADTVIASFPVSSGDPEHVLHQAGNG